MQVCIKFYPCQVSTIVCFLQLGRADPFAYELVNLLGCTYYYCISWYSIKFNFSPTPLI